MSKGPNRSKAQYFLVVAALAIMGAMYVFQRVDFLKMLTAGSTDFHPYTYFIVNKSIRFLINDLCCILIVTACFREQKYLRAAVIVFIIEILIILPVYFSIKLTLEGDSEISSPLLSQIHRLIVNPILMIVLIFSFFYQEWMEKKSNSATK